MDLDEVRDGEVDDESLVVGLKSPGTLPLGTCFASLGAGSPRHARNTSSRKPKTPVPRKKGFPSRASPLSLFGSH